MELLCLENEQHFEPTKSWRFGSDDFFPFQLDEFSVQNVNFPGCNFQRTHDLDDVDPPASDFRWSPVDSGNHKTYRGSHGGCHGRFETNHTEIA